MIVLAVDPGSKKCGLAVLSQEEGILKRMVVPLEQAAVACQGLVADYKVQLVLVGGSTGSAGVVLNLKSCLDLDIKVVDEKFSTERAKTRYFQDNPPKGLQKLLPVSMLVPNEPYDDYAAVIMAEDYLAKLG